MCRNKSKFPEGHPAHRAGDSATHSLQGKPWKNPAWSQKHQITLGLCEHTECSNWCHTGLHQPSADTSGHLPRLHLAPCGIPGAQAAAARTLVSGPSCQLCPQGFITASGSNLSNTGASGSLSAGEPRKICCSPGPGANVPFCQRAAFLMGKMYQVTVPRELLCFPPCHSDSPQLSPLQVWLCPPKPSCSSGSEAKIPPAGRGCELLQRQSSHQHSLANIVSLATDTGGC